MKRLDKPASVERSTDAHCTYSSKVESAGVHSQAVTQRPPQAGTTFFPGYTQLGGGGRGERVVSGAESLKRKWVGETRVG